MIMKKTLLGIALAAAAMCAMTSCEGGRADHRRADGDRKDVYTGVLPAADCAGIRYTLKLDYDDDHNYTDGDYDLVETYLVADTLARLDYRDSVSYKSKGDFSVATDPRGGKYLELVPDRRFRQADKRYFLVSSDSTLTLTTRDLTLPESGLDYTLKIVR